VNSLFDSLDGISIDTAEFSPCGVYRYTLTRNWSEGPCIGWLLFNPSVATAELNDHTIRKTIGFSKRWGFGRLIILNLYAVRNTDPRAVTRMGVSAIGPMNDYWILKSIGQASELVCAWGCAQHAPEIDSRIDYLLTSIRDKFPDAPMRCLGYRKDGHPRHPLMIGYDTERVEFEARK
jgi:hypothetical protein